MMHYQAVASPAGVINDVTHHTILPPLLSITSALVKCTTNFWHNATMYLCTSTYKQHLTAWSFNCTWYFIFWSCSCFYATSCIFSLLPTTTHTHHRCSCREFMHHRKIRQAHNEIAANLAHPFLILLRMCSQHCILLTTNWSHFLDKHTFTFWCWHKQGWMSVNGETLLTLERVND